MSRKSIAFIGGATNSAIGHAHISAALMDGRWDIQPSYFSDHPEVNEDTHRAFGIPWKKHYGDYLEYLDSNRHLVDLLVIATPSPMHHQMILDALDRGIPTLVEKPIACSATEALEIEDKLKATPSAYLRYVHNYSSYPMYKELETMLRRGAVGEIKHIVAQAPSDGFARTKRTGPPQLWRQEDGEIPMLALDLATHLYHLVRRIKAPKQGKLLAIANNITAPFSVIDNMQIHCESSEDVLIDYWFSKAHLGIKNGLAVRVYGNEGSIEWVQEAPDQIIFSDLDSNKTIINRGAIDHEIAKSDRFKAGHPTGFVEALGYFYSDLYEDLKSFCTNGQGCPWIEVPETACKGISFLNDATHSFREQLWKKNVLV